MNYSQFVRKQWGTGIAHKYLTKLFNDLIMDAINKGINHQFNCNQINKVQWQVSR